MYDCSNNRELCDPGEASSSLDNYNDGQTLFSKQNTARNKTWASSLCAKTVHFNFTNLVQVRLSINSNVCYKTKKCSYNCWKFLKKLYLTHTMTEATKSKFNFFKYTIIKLEAFIALLCATGIYSKKT